MPSAYHLMLLVVLCSLGIEAQKSFTVPVIVDFSEPSTTPWGASVDYLHSLGLLQNITIQYEKLTVGYSGAEAATWIHSGVYDFVKGTFNFTNPIVWADNTTTIPDLDIRPPFHFWSCKDREMGYDPTGKTIRREKPDGDDVSYIDSDYYCDGFMDCRNLSDEGFDCVTDYPALFISYGILTGILILLAVLMIPFVLFFGCCVKRKRVTASSPTFLLLIIVSVIVGFASTFAWYGKPQPVACGFQPWLLGLATISMIAALSAKTFRIWRIFKSMFTRVVITDLELIILWGLIMLPAVVILFLWTLISTPTAELQEKDGMEHFVCATGGFTGYPGGYVFFSIFVAYGVVVVAFALFLSIVTRRVPTLFNDSTLIAISIYNITFLAAVGIPVVIVLQEIQPFAAWIVRTSAILYVFSATLCLQFVPKIVGIFVIDCGRDHEFTPESSNNKSTSSGSTTAETMVITNSASGVMM